MSALPGANGADENSPAPNALHVVLCNGADCNSLPSDPSGSDDKPRHCFALNYLDVGGTPPNVRLGLPNFVRDVYHLPDRFLDLLEIATYVYCADRWVSRGPKHDLIYERWARSFHFVVRVRDVTFWQHPEVGRLLGDLLAWVAGDRLYQFTFVPGHATPRTSVFDNEEFLFPPDDGEVIFFSGGLDSLAGVSERLTKSNKRVYLVSHQSGQTGIVRTQKQMVESLKRDFPGRVEHYRFKSGLTNHAERREETQRSRFFLYASIAFALAYAQGKDTIYAYENGITSLNLPKQQSTINGRASRTTHPKTIHLLRQFLPLVADKSFSLETPYFWHTKTDVLDRLAQNGFSTRYASAVSCTKVFKTAEGCTHCGTCSQCVDRRLAAFAAGLGEFDDNGTYTLDFMKQEIEDGEAHTVVTDYLRQATEFAKSTADSFQRDRLYELTDIVDHIGVDEEEEAVHRLWELCHRHGQQVLLGVKNARDLHENLLAAAPKGSLFHIVDAREYLKEPVERLVGEVCARLGRALPIACQRQQPVSENHQNDLISACLNSDQEAYQREFPYIAFALARTVPDHYSAKHDLLIETKFLRGDTTQSKVTDALAADILKYTVRCYRLFVVYDPERKVHDDQTFSRAFEAHPRCKVSIVR